MLQDFTFTGIILAGGESRRLCYNNKALLRVGGKSIIERIAGALNEVTERNLLVTNSPKAFRHLGIPLFSDIFPRSGPLGGIHAGLTASETDYNLVIACDMPFIRPCLLRLLMDQSKGYDIVIPVTLDGYHPLCAVYSKECINPIEELIGTRKLKVTELFSYVKVKRLIFDVDDPLYKQNVFFNINTGDDYLTAISLAYRHNSIL